MDDLVARAKVAADAREITDPWAASLLLHLAAALEAGTKDAARYRFLRDRAGSGPLFPLHVTLHFDARREIGLDAAIDAAIAERLTVAQES